MSEPILGEIQMFPFPLVPHGWVRCDGTALPRSQYRSLDILLAGRFGQDARNFFVPNLSDHIPGGAGSGGERRSARVVGDAYGAEMVTLKEDNLITHSHWLASYATRDTQGRKGTPGFGDRLTSPALAFAYNAQHQLVNTTLSPDIMEETGGNQPMENRQPYIGVGFCMSVAGDYPDFA